MSDWQGVWMCLTFWVMGGSTCRRKGGGREQHGFNPSSSDMLNQKFSLDLKPLIIAGVVSRRAMFNPYSLKVGSNHVDFQVWHTRDHPLVSAAAVAAVGRLLRWEQGMLLYRPAACTGHLRTLLTFDNSLLLFLNHHSGWENRSLSPAELSLLRMHCLCYLGVSGLSHSWLFRGSLHSAIGTLRAKHSYRDEAALCPSGALQPHLGVKLHSKPCSEGYNNTVEISVSHWPNSTVYHKIL